MRTYESTIAEIEAIAAEQRAIVEKAEPTADDADFLLKAEGEIGVLRRLASELHEREVAELRRQLAAAKAAQQAAEEALAASQAAQAADYGRYYGANGASAVLGRLSNPFAWAQLFESIKRGDFKRK